MRNPFAVNKERGREEGVRRAWTSSLRIKLASAPVSTSALKVSLFPEACTPLRLSSSYRLFRSPTRSTLTSLIVCVNHIDCNLTGWAFGCVDHCADLWENRAKSRTRLSGMRSFFQLASFGACCSESSGVFKPDPAWLGSPVSSLGMFSHLTADLASYKHPCCPIPW